MARCVNYGHNTENNIKSYAWNLEASTADPTEQNGCLRGQWVNDKSVEATYKL